MATSVYLGGGGGGTPASPTTSIQFNNAGAFGGSANLEWDGTAEWNKLRGFIGPSQLLVSDPNNIPGPTAAGLTVDIFNTDASQVSAIKYNAISSPPDDGESIGGYNGGIASANNNTHNYSILFNINASAYHQGSGTVDFLRGAFIDVEAFPGTNTLPGTVTLLQGIEVFTFIDPTETVATAVGIDIDNVSGAVANYALRTGTGFVKLGGLPSTDPALANVLWKAGSVVALGNNSGEVDVVSQSGASGNTPGSPLVLTAGDGAGSGLGGSVLITAGGSGSGTVGDIRLTTAGGLLKISSTTQYQGSQVIDTTHTASDSYTFRGWDTSGATARQFIKVTAGNPPTLSITPPVAASVTVQANTYKSSDGSTGATGTANNTNTLTIKNGLVTVIA